MIKRDVNKINKMNELAEGDIQLRNIEDLSPTDLRSMVYVLIERIKRIEKETEERSKEAKQRFEGFPKDYVSSTLYDRDIKVLQDNVKNISDWKETSLGSAGTRAAILNLFIGVFGGAIGSIVTFIFKGAFA